MAPKYAHIITYGCQMNKRDSELIGGMLAGMGYQLVDDPAAADVIVVNTCTVRDSADQKILGHIGHLNRYKLERPDLVIAVGGCLAQDPSGRERLAKRAPFIDVVFGTSDMHRLPELLAAAAAGQQIAVSDDPTRCPDRERDSVRGSGPRAYVNITYGCDNFCSYCIVPYVRGRVVSRPLADILAEVQELVASGYKEVVLLGQNVNAYGGDLRQPTTFGELLRRLNDVPDLVRIRYTTSHPRDFSIGLIDDIMELERVCRHFHLPVQAGSDEILKAMNRGYDREHYLSLVQHIRRRDPLAGLSTDIIVGFPGETDRDFRDTLDLVRQAQFDNAFTFLYSPRRGTPAAAHPNPVPPEVKRRRLNALMRLQNAISLQRNRELVGRQLTVLVEGPSKHSDDVWAGRTDSNKVVHFAPDGVNVGDLVVVAIERAATWALTGRIIRSRQVSGDGV